MRVLFVGCLCIAAASPAAAADQYDLSGMIRPGLWETQTQQIASDGTAGPVETDRDCITPSDIQDFSSFVRGDDDNSVTVEEFARGDDFVRYRMRFASDDPDVDVNGMLSGDMQFEGQERYRGTMTFAMTVQNKSFESKTRIDARRIGDCSEEDF
ncbi:MAG TPA: DUF3617 family protein [Pseudomonadales bacterium]